MLNRKKLKDLRKSFGFTQEELGKLSGVSNASICGYEIGTKTPDIDTLSNLSQALNTTPNYLLDFDVRIDLINENIDESYNHFVSNETIKFLKELDKHEETKNKFLDNPKKWLNVFDKKFN